MNDPARIARGATLLSGSRLAPALALLLAACSGGEQSGSAGGCAGVDTALTEAQRQSEAGRVARALQRDPASLQLTRVMRQGDWTLVWATPNDMEAGVFFLKRGAQPELVETWGGVATPEERAEIAQWARKLPGNPPPELAECFASAVVSEGQ